MFTLENAEKLVRTSSRSPLALVALSVLVVAVLVQQALQDEQGWIKIAILDVMVLSLLSFIAIVFLSNSDKEDVGEGFADEDLHPFQSALLEQFKNEYLESKNGVTSLSFATRMNWETKSMGSESIDML